MLPTQLDYKICFTFVPKNFIDMNKIECKDWYENTMSDQILAVGNRLQSWRKSSRPQTAT